MKTNDNLKFALHTAVLVEKQSFDFYMYAANMVNNNNTGKLFKLLASEEAEHLGAFHRLYQEHKFGNLQDLIDLPTDFNTPIYHALLASVDVNSQVREALEIALREEKACLKTYSDLASAFSDSGVRNIFEQALRETRKHCEIIQAEYMRVLCLPGTSDNVQETPNLIVINPKREDAGFTSRLTSKFQRLLTGLGHR